MEDDEKLDLSQQSLMQEETETELQGSVSHVVDDEEKFDMSEEASEIPYFNDRDGGLSDFYEEQELEVSQSLLEEADEELSDEPEVIEEDKKETEKAEKLNKMTSDEQSEAIKELILKGLREEQIRKLSGKEVTDLAIRGAKGAGAAFMQWIKNEPVEEKVKDVGKVVAIAAENTINSLASLGPDVYNFIAQQDVLTPQEMDKVPEEWQTPAKRTMALIIAFFAAWGTASKSTGILKKWKNLKNLKGADKAKSFGTVFAQEMLLNGALDFVLLDPKDGSLGGDLLNSIEGIEKVIPDWVESDEDDERLMVRIKNFVTGAGFGGGIELTLQIAKGLFHVTKALKIRVSKDATLLRKSLAQEGVNSSETMAQKLVDRADDKPQVEKPVVEKPAGKKAVEGKAEDTLPSSKEVQMKGVIENFKTKDEVLQEGVKKQLMQNEEVLPASVFYDDKKGVANIGEEIIKGGSPLHPSESVKRGVYKTIVQRDANIDFVVEKLDTGVSVTPGKLKNILAKYADEGLDLNKIDPEALIHLIRNIGGKDHEKILMKYLDALKSPSKKHLSKINKDKFVRGALDTKLEGKGGKTKPIEIDQKVTAESAVIKTEFRKKILERIKDLSEKIEISKSVGNIDRYASEVKEVLELLEKYSLLDTATNQIRATTGTVLESQRPPKNVAIDHSAMNKILGNKELSMIEKMDAFLKGEREGLFDMKKVMDNGVEKYIKEPKKGLIENILNTAGDMIIGLQLSDPASKLATIVGNIGFMVLKNAEEFVEYGFNKGFQLMRRGKHAPQSIENFMITRLGGYIVNFKHAAKNFTEHLAGLKKLDEMSHIEKGKGGKALWRFMGAEAPLQKLSDWLGELAKKEGAKLDVLRGSRTLKTLATVGHYFVESLEATLGLRAFKSIDGFVGDLNISTSIRKVVARIENKLNKIRAERGGEPLSGAALEKRIEVRTRKELENRKYGDSSDILDEARLELKEMTYMNSKAGIAGGKGYNIGEGARTINHYLKKVPFLGRILTPYTTVILSAADTLSRRIPVLNSVNPAIRNLWKTDQYSRLLSESITGTTIASGLLYLNYRDSESKRIIVATTKAERKALKEIIGLDAFSPVEIDLGKGEAYAYDETSPIGGLMAFWARFYKYADDFKDHKEIGLFFSDLGSSLIQSVTPSSLAKQWMQTEDFFKEKIEFGFVSAKVLANFLNSGVVKRTTDFKRGYRVHDNISQKGEVDENGNFIVQEDYYKVRYNKIMKNINFLFGGEDVGVGMTDGLGNPISVADRSAREPLDTGEMKDYMDLGKNFAKEFAKTGKSYYNFMRKKIPVSFEPLHEKLWDISETTGINKEMELRNPIKLHPARKISLISVVQDKALRKLINEKDAGDYLDFTNPDAREAFNNIITKEFIVNDKAAQLLDMISAGDVPVDLNGEKVTGEQIIKKIFNEYYKADTKFLKIKLRERLGKQMFERIGKYIGTFEQYGYSKKEALKTLMFNPKRKSVETEFNRRVKLRETVLGRQPYAPEKRVMLRTILNDDKFYKSPFRVNLEEREALKTQKGEEEAVLRKGVATGSISLSSNDPEANYILSDIMLNHVDAKHRAVLKSAMRGYVNNVIKPYNEMARFAYVQEFIVNDKNFRTNLLTQVEQEMFDSAEDLIRDEKGNRKFHNTNRKK